MSDGVLIAVIGAVAAGISGLVTWVTTRGTLDAEAGQRAAAIYKGAIDHVTSENAALREDVKALRAEVADYRRLLGDCQTACRRLAYRIDPNANIGDNGLPDIGPNGTLH